MTKTSKTSKMTKGQKWLMMTWKDLKWLEMTWNDLKSLEITWNDLKWLELAFDFLVVRKMICIIFCCFLSSGCFIVLRKHFWWLIKAYQNLFSLLNEEEHFKSVSNEKSRISIVTDWLSISSKQNCWWDEKHLIKVRGQICSVVFDLSYLLFNWNQKMFLFAIHLSSN